MHVYVGLLAWVCVCICAFVHGCLSVCVTCACVHVCLSVCYVCVVHVCMYVHACTGLYPAFLHSFWGIPLWPLGSYNSFSLTDPCPQPSFAKVSSLTLCYSVTRFAFPGPTLEPLVPLCFPKHCIWFVALRAAPRSHMQDFVLYWRSISSGDPLCYTSSSLA